MELTREWVQSQFGIGVEHLYESEQFVDGKPTKCVRFDTQEAPWEYYARFVLCSPEKVKCAVVQAPEVISGIIRLTDDGPEGTRADHNFSYKITTRFLFYKVN